MCSMTQKPHKNTKSLQSKRPYSSEYATVVYIFKFFYYSILNDYLTLQMPVFSTKQAIPRIAPLNDQNEQVITKIRINNHKSFPNANMLQSGTKMLILKSFIKKSEYLTR